MMHKLSIVMVTGAAGLVMMCGSAQAGPKGKTGPKIHRAEYDSDWLLKQKIRTNT